MKTKIMITLAGVVMASAAMAAEPGLYVGANVGASKQDVNTAGDKSDTPTTYGVYGGYNFDKHFGVELGYQGLGSVSATQTDGNTARARTDAYSADFVARLPVTERLDVYGKAGLVRYERRYAGIDGASSDSGTGAKFALGTEYAVTQRVGLRAEVAQYQGIPDRDQLGASFKDSSTVFTLGANYRF
ncbi:MAG: porin family protein [Rhodocyclaceae bacterium]|jgi:OmpA-OmpF porin, OOP family